MRSGRWIAVPVMVAAVLPSVLVLPVPAAALGARLAGGSRQAAIRRAFDAGAAHRHRLIASIRVSTVDPAWSVVRSLTAASPGRTSSEGGTLRLTSAYYHRVAGAERPGTPPVAVRADLDRELRVAVVYSGAGTESISYTRNSCDAETVTVQPMSWTVRYVVNLDDILGAAQGPLGSAVVPAVAFTGRGSRLSAVEQLTRMPPPSCATPAAPVRCTRTFQLGGGDPAGQLSVAADGGLDIGLPVRVTSTGACAPEDYILGPSLWDEGAGAADAAALGLFGGSLPANPYAPIGVSWPGSSGREAQLFASSPCLGDLAACTDTFQWRGTVRLAAVS